MKAPARIFGPPVPPEDVERLRDAAPDLFVALVNVLRLVPEVPEEAAAQAIAAIHKAGGRVG